MRSTLQSLTGAAEFGHDQAAFTTVLRRTLANGAGQIDHRERDAAQGRDAAHVGVAVGDLGQLRTGDYFIDLQQVDAQQPAAVQPEQQQGQGIPLHQSHEIFPSAKPLNK